MGRVVLTALNTRYVAIAIIETHYVSMELYILEAEEISGRPEYLFGRPDIRKVVTSFCSFA
jgi:hypothetical protein